MRTKILLSLFTLALAGCGKKYEMVNVCSCEQMQKVGYFVERSLADANNHSDEEMEDVANELFEIGVKTTCPLRAVEYNNGWVVGECETAYRIVNY